MKVTFDRSFLKSIERNNVKYLKDSMLGFIELVDDCLEILDKKNGYRLKYPF